MTNVRWLEGSSNPYADYTWNGVIKNQKARLQIRKIKDGNYDYWVLAVYRYDY